MQEEVLSFLDRIGKKLPQCTGTDYGGKISSFDKNVAQMGHIFQFKATLS